MFCYCEFNVINTFAPNTPFLYHLETSENFTVKNCLKVPREEFKILNQLRCKYSIFGNMT